MKIARGLAGGFLMQISFTVLPPDFIISSGKSKHNIGGDFRHFIFFKFSTAFMKQFVHVLDRVLSSYRLSTSSFILTTFCGPV
jgi:hypothetical protein